MFNNLITKIKASSRIQKILNISLIVCFALYIFSIPSFSGRAKLNLISYAFMGLSAALVIAKYIFYEKFFFDKRLLILLFFVLEAFIGTAVWSHSFRHWITIVLLYITFVIFYYGFNAINNRKLIYKIIAYAFLAFGIYFAFVYRKNILHFNLNEPLGNDFDNVNTIGTYFSLGYAIFLYLGLSNTKKIELLYILPAGFMLFLGLFTGSRHFIITTGAAFITVVLVSFKKRKWIAALVIVAAIALFFATIQLPAFASFKERINRGISTLFGIGNAKYDPSTMQRTIWPQYGLDLGIRNLFFGYGADGFSIYSGIETYSHNTYSEIVCNFGLFGTILFFFALIYPLILAISSKDRNINIIFVIVVFYLAKGFFGVYFSTKDTYLMLALLFYLVRDVRLGEYVGFRNNRIPTKQGYYEVSI